MSSAVQLRLARPDDDDELRRLLRETPMTGEMTLTLEREPSFFLGRTIEGERHQTIVGQEPHSGRLMSLASRSVRTAWIDGEPRPLGYLSQLRFDRRRRGVGRLLRRGFRTMEQLHQDGAAPFYVTTIVEDNRVARRVLEASWPGKPTYRPLTTLCSLALPLWRRQRERPPRGVRVGRATTQHLGQIAALLQRSGERFQLSPLWLEQDLRHPERCRGLHPQDFWVATRGSRVVGCVALWDQRSFKQTVLRGCSPRLQRLRRVNNALAPLTGWPRLPLEGQQLHHAFLSHLALVPGDQGALLPLLAAACNAARDGGLLYVLLGLTTAHPALWPVRAAFSHLEYRSRVYLVHWGADGPRLDLRRVPQPELAVL